MSTPRTIPLAAIVGRSRYNVRPEDNAAGVDAMAASLMKRGQIQNLTVHVSDNPDQYEIVDGGCRWAAMQKLVDRGIWPWQHPVRVLEIGQDAAAAIECSLAANIVRSDLHPVEQFEAFSRLIVEGMEVETIAADFGISTRTVRQRLTYDRLSARVRSAWRDGMLSAAAAEVLTGAADHAAQDALLDRYPPAKTTWSGWWLDDIRRKLQAGTMRGDSAEARYVGIDAYVAADGGIDDNLFEPHPLFLDAPLLKQLARQKMLQEGEALAAREGYGFVMISEEIGSPAGWRQLPVVMTEHDQAALDAIEEEEEALDVIDEEQDAAFEARREAILARTRSRGATAAERQAAGIIISLVSSGMLSVERGWVPPVARPEGAPAAGALAPPPKAKAKASSAAPEPEPPQQAGKALLAVMDEAMTAAYAALVGQDLDLAVVLAAAALMTPYNASAIRIWALARPKDAKPIVGFRDALERVFHAAKTGKDLWRRLAEAVADTIMVAPASIHRGMRHGSEEATVLAEVVAHYAGDQYAPAMVAALDYDAYFAAATKAATLGAMEAAGGDIKSVKALGKADLAKAAAILCRDKAWLPPELRPPQGKLTLKAKMPKPTPEPPPISLADAMVAAIDADEAAKGEAPVAIVTPAVALDIFLLAHTRADDAREMIKASELFEAFRSRMAPEVAAAIPTVQIFASAVADYGIAKKRLKTGIHYLGLTLVEADAAVADQAAE